MPAAISVSKLNIVEASPGNIQFSKPSGALRPQPTLAIMVQHRKPEVGPFAHAFGRKLHKKHKMAAAAAGKMAAQAWRLAQNDGRSRNWWSGNFAMALETLGRCRSGHINAAQATAELVPGTSRMRHFIQGLPCDPRLVARFPDTPLDVLDDVHSRYPHGRLPPNIISSLDRHVVPWHLGDPDDLPTSGSETPPFME